MPTETEIMLLLPSQQLILARAALAGVTYERVHDQQRIWNGENRDWVDVTRVRAKWPNGAYVAAPGRATIREFDDEIEAALFVMDWLDDPHDAVKAVQQGCSCPSCRGQKIVMGFGLYEGNEQ